MPRCKLRTLLATISRRARAEAYDDDVIFPELGDVNTGE